MAPVSIQLKVISCKDLKAFNFFQKLSVYAAVSIVEDSDSNSNLDQKARQLQKTPIDKEGDGNPVWNHEIQFDVKKIASSSNIDQIFLQFHLISEVIILGAKTIGEVRVPFDDLIGEYNGAVRYVSYQVKSPDGNPNGVLDFSYKVIDDKIGKRLYPAIDSSDFHVSSPSQNTSYPPPGTHYPSSEAHYPPPPTVHYPPPEVHYPPAEVCCTASPQIYPPLPSAPLPEMVYYPPPPPPPQPTAYRTPPPPYTLGYAGGYYPACTYPTVHQCDDDTWPKGEEFRSSSWNLR